MTKTTRDLSVVVGLAFGVLPASPARAQPDPVIQKVEEAWKARQEQLRTIRIAWDENITMFKGGLTDATGTKANDGGPFPPADKSITRHYELAFDGDKIRLEYRGPYPNVAENSWTNASYTQVYDGKTGLHYRDQSQLGSTVYTGSREVDEAPTQLRMSNLLPVLQTMRAATPALSFFDLSRFRNSGRKARIGGRECLELSFMTKSGKGSNSLWVDPSRGYVLVRRQIVYSNASSPAAAVQEEIEYQEPVPGVWVPRGWTRINKGWKVPVSMKIVSTVTLVELPKSIPSERFDTTPPPRSFITERDGDARTSFIVRPDGSRETVEPGRVSEAMQELVTPSTTSWWRSNRWIVVVGSVVLAITLVGLVRKNRTIRASGRGDFSNAPGPESA